MSIRAACLLLCGCCVMAVFGNPAANPSPHPPGADHSHLHAGIYTFLAVASAGEKALEAPEPEGAGVPGQAPSLIQSLEGREGDLTIWISIAVIFFLGGWLGGNISERRRERSRRGRLRF
jgi:hypothetical protein